MGNTVTPYISIAISMYKTLYIRDSIDSVLSQSYQNFELIIINDGPSSNIEEIRSYFNDSRIRFFQNEFNEGLNSLASVWNHCLSYARGKYFIMFSDDDLMNESFVEQMVDLISKKPNHNVYRCLVEIIDKDNNILRRVDIAPECESSENYLSNRISGQRVHYLPELVFNTARLRAVGGFVDFPLGWYTDEATLLLLSLDAGIITLNKHLVSWRYSDINISSNGDFLRRIDASQKYFDWLEKNVLCKFSGSSLTKIKIAANDRNEKNKKNVIIRTARQKLFFGVLDILKNGFIVKQKYGMDILLIFMALLSFIKNYSRRNY